MNQRIKRLATDWKTYTGLVAGIASVLNASPEFFQRLTDTFSALKKLPPETRWIAAGLFGIAAVFALLAAWSRKSILLRPERFILSADDPQHLVGREDEIKALADQCERHPLVFLQGESGAGKSSLVQAGLLPFCLAGEKAVRPSARRLLPLRIDASSMVWHDGLRVELARAVRSITETDRVQLGAEKPLDSGDVLEWLAGMPRDAARQLLVVIDQIDDYAVAHRQHFVSANTVVSPETFEQSSGDWAAIARLARDGILHLVIVCRSDAAGVLDALRFTQTTTFLLPRIESKLISPILDRVTANDDLGEVVSDPEFGWQQLKDRLLSDASVGGISVLPVQLAVALDSLRRFRFLTPVEYAKAGALRGLERLHIERHVREAARAMGIEEVALLRGLMCLVTEDGLKTKRAQVAEFQEKIGRKGSDRNELQPVIDHLVRGRILRRQNTEDGDYLLLHHDYLARGVREAYRQTNFWEELLRERGQEFTHAFGWRQRWRTLLPLSAQWRLGMARVRRRFHYGPHRRFAIWSLTRLVPLVVFAGFIYGAGWWVDDVIQGQVAERMLAGISTDDKISEAEAQEWINLASARDVARFHAVDVALSKDSMVPKIEARSEIFGHAVVGLDPTGALSRELFEKTILPSLVERGARDAYLSAVAMVAYIRCDQTEASRLLLREHVGKPIRREGHQRGSCNCGKKSGALSARPSATLVNSPPSRMRPAPNRRTNSSRRLPIRRPSRCCRTRCAFGTTRSRSGVNLKLTRFRRPLRRKNDHRNSPSTIRESSLFR